MNPEFEGRVGLQQRVLPHYRQPFFDRLAAACRAGLSVFAGQPRPGEAIIMTDKLDQAQYWPAHNRHILSGAFYLCWQTNILDWLTATQPKALILEANPRYLSNRKAMKWMKARKLPVLGWGLGASPASGLSGPIRQAARRSYYAQFDAMIAYSSQGAEQFAAYGLPQEALFVALNSVSPAPPQPAQRPPLNNRPLRILFVGRLQPRKRVDLLLRACQALQQTVQLHVVGDGPARDEWMHLAAQVFPTAEFTGALTGQDLDQQYRWADIFVLPGTGGLAVQEAMAHGLPVIVAQGDGTQRDLVTRQTGWLVAPGDQASLVAALRSAMDQPDQLVEMGRAAYQFVVEHANIDAMVRVFVEALKYALGEA